MSIEVGIVFVDKIHLVGQWEPAFFSQIHQRVYGFTGGIRKGCPQVVLKGIGSFQCPFLDGLLKAVGQTALFIGLSGGSELGFDTADFVVGENSTENGSAFMTFTNRLSPFLIRFELAVSLRFYHVGQVRIKLS